MARKYAFINNNVVVDVKSLEPEDLQSYLFTYECVLDIEDMIPQPTIGYVLNGNILEIPQNNSSREKFEIDLSIRKIEFGMQLSKICVAKMGARNKILNKSGAQVSAILTSLLPVKLLLETGALSTARGACSQLKLYYTEYSDIFDECIREVNTFESTYGV